LKLLIIHNLTINGVNGTATAINSVGSVSSGGFSKPATAKRYNGNNQPAAEKHQSMPAEEVAGRQQCSEVTVTKSLKVRVIQNLTINWLRWYNNGN